MMEGMPAPFRLATMLLLGAGVCTAQSYSAPAGIRPALRHTGASILPGGRIVAPLGTEYPTGPGAFGLAISSSGKWVATSNTGPGRNSLTLLERQKSGEWDVRQVVPPTKDPQEKPDPDDWKGAFMGLAFAGERGVYASEG